MKTHKILLSFLAISCISLFFLTQATSQEQIKNQNIDIFFIHDVHSWIDRAPNAKPIIDEAKAKNSATLFLDAGDFSMGTIYQTVFSNTAAELITLGELGVDVTTLGNHEFDYGSQNLVNMFQAALASDKKLPKLAISNIDWTTKNKATETLRKAIVDDYGAKDYFVIQKEDTKIAVIGVFGKDALYCAPTCELTILDQIKSVKNTVNKIKQTENVDMIVCISHSGTSYTPSKSEDELLAKAVPELDLIISGHSHTLLKKPIVVGDTFIISCGNYLEYLGHANLSQTQNNRWKINSYELIPITQDLPEDSSLRNLLNSFRQSVDSDYFSKFNLKTSTPLIKNNIDFHYIEEYQDQHVDKNRSNETPLVTIGQFIADSYAYVLNNLKLTSNTNVDITAVPAGMIRGIYPNGIVTAEDVYQTFSLGIGPDDIPGYPLVTVKLTGKELKAMAEIDATVSYFMPTSILYLNGFSYKWNSFRLPFNRVTDAAIIKDGIETPVIDNQLYTIATDIYTGRMLAGLLEQTFGLLSIIPKDDDGNPITNIEDRIIYDENGIELKAWNTVPLYMQSFTKNNGELGDIPAYYAERITYKVKDSSFNLKTILKSPSKLSLIIRYVIIFVIVIITIVAILLIKRRKRLSK